MRSWSYKEWYKENKEALSKKRKKKYKKCREYKAECKARSLIYYRTHKRKTVPVDRFKVQTVAGDNYVTIGRVARTISRSVQTVRLYHTEGLIPLPLYFDKRGWRLYAKSQLGVLKLAFEAWDKKEITKKDVAEILSKNWGGLVL